MANKDTKLVVTNQIGISENENVGDNEEIRKLRRQIIEMHRAWANGLLPPTVPTDNLEYLSSLPPVSHAQFPIFVDMPQHASGLTPGKQYPTTSKAHSLTPQSKTTIYSAPTVVHAFAAPPPLEAPTFDHYALEPTFKSTGPYDCPQPPKFHPNTEKPVMTEEQKEITRKLKSLELTMKNLQGLGGYKSVSYKDLCMFPGVHLPFDFKMLKFEKYDRHGDPE
ncbi:hypothetical protein P3S67_002978 [Capsicum chacoense]